MVRLRSIALAFVCLLAVATHCPAAPTEAQREPDPPPKTFVTTHELTLGGKRLRYKAIAAELDVADASGKPQARIFSTTYLRDGADAESRPVTFAFNGGPGSASIWLHLGLLGPKRVV